VALEARALDRFGFQMGIRSIQVPQAECFGKRQKTLNFYGCLTFAVSQFGTGDSLAFRHVLCFAMLISPMIMDLGIASLFGTKRV